MLQDLNTQELYLELIKRTSFNNFDGPQIVRSLLENRHLWLSAMMLSDKFGLMLRDLPEHENTVDTLYLLVKKEQAYQLAFLACNEWRADEVNEPIIGDKLAGYLGSYSREVLEELALVRVWWQ